MNSNEQNMNLLEDFLASLKEQGRSPATVETYRRSLEKFFEFIKSEGVFNVRRVPLEMLFEFHHVLAEGGGSAVISPHEDRILGFYKWISNKEGGRPHGPNT